MFETFEVCMHVVKGGCTLVHFVVVVLNDSLRFGIISEVRNAKDSVVSPKG